MAFNGLSKAERRHEPSKQVGVGSWSSTATFASSEFSFDDRDPSGFDLLHENNDETTRHVGRIERGFEKRQLYKDMYSVAIPAVAASIVEPLLTLVDTYCIGKFMNPLQSTVGLAGMSVNGAIFNVIAAATYPLCTATTSLVSDAMGKVDLEKYNNDKIGNRTANVLDDLSSPINTGVIVPSSPTSSSSSSSSSSPSTSSPQALAINDELRSIFVNGVVMAALFGSIISGLLIYTSDGLLRRGFPDLEPAVLDGAKSYLRIRALSLPSVMINDVVVGFSLGVQNVVAPMLSLTIAFVVNVVGDFILIGLMGLGLRGAALATTISSYVGTAVAALYLANQYGLLKSLLKVVDLIPSSCGRRSTVSNKDGNGAPKWCSLINMALLRAFFSASGYIFAGSMIDTLTFSLGARIASFSGGTVSDMAATSTIHVAAHQIVMQTW